MSLTEFHFVLLYSDRVVGISNLNEQLAYEEMLPLVRTNRYLHPSPELTLNGVVSFRKQMRKSEGWLRTPFERHTGSTPTNHSLS